MTDGDDKKGFSGLDRLVSDVDKGLKDAQRSNPQQPPKQAPSLSPSARPRPEAGPASTQQPKRFVPPPPIDSGSGGSRVWLWILGGFILFSVWAANQDGGSSRPTSFSSTSNTPPSTSHPEPAPSLPTLSTPPVGTNHVHSTAEIRYCVAADIRIEALRPNMNSDSQVDAFNGLVSDYNSRCGSYKYQPGSDERARREIEPYRAAIVANAWDGISLSAATTPQQVRVVQPSQLTTDIQISLLTLGYDPGVADGIFGSKTKTAIEAFQQDYGLGVDGIENQELLRQLRSAVELKERERTIDRSLVAPDAELQEAPRATARSAQSFQDQFEAEIWLTDMSRRLERQIPDLNQRLELLERVHYESTLAGLEPELVLAVIDVGSNFDPNAKSVAGALGLMQVMPFWRYEIGRPDDNLIRLETNLRYGCTILKFYLDQEKGDLRRALSLYNGSPGRGDYPNQVMKRLSEKWYQI